MPTEQKFLVMKTALEMICKVLRQHPTEMDWYLEDMERLQILTGGSERDPEGKEWTNYFVIKAYEQLKAEGVIE